MRDLNKFEILPIEEYCDEELRGKLIQKLRLEYNAYISKLYSMTPQKIVAKSFEKNSQEDLVNICRCMRFSDEEYELMLEKDDLLSSFYFHYLISRNDFDQMLGKAILDTVEELKKEQGIGE